jgi:carboxyl-terminal processing protease
VEITREKVELKDSEAQSKIFEAGQKAPGRPYQIGVIRLPSFYMDMTGAKQGLDDYRSTTRDVRRLLGEFNAKGVDALILDLRHNGGGSLPEAINLTALFVGDGPIVQVKGVDGRVQPYRDQDQAAVWTKPMIVLTSKFSASASEILAGAIQDYHRGLIVGDPTTHGKGTVQSLIDLAEQLFRIPNTQSLGALKITVQQFYRPNGDSTQKRGVEADVELPSLTSHLEGVGEADLDHPMSFDHVEPAAFKPFGLVDKAVFGELRSRSSQRSAKSVDFQKVQRNIARYEEQKKRKRVTLNEKEFMAERAETNAEKEEEKKLEEVINPDKTGVERNFYLDEAIAIVVDYLGLLQAPGQPKLVGPAPPVGKPGDATAR